MVRRGIFGEIAKWALRHGASTGRRFGELFLLHLFNEGGSIDIEELCRLCLHPVGLVQGFKNEFSLIFLDGLVKNNAVLRDRDFNRLYLGALALDRVWDILQFNLIATCQNAHPFNHVLKFTYIPRPVVGDQGILGF